MSFTETKEEIKLNRIESGEAIVDLTIKELANIIKDSLKEKIFFLSGANQSKVDKIVPELMTTIEADLKKNMRAKNKVVLGAV